MALWGIMLKIDFADPEILNSVNVLLLSFPNDSDAVCPQSTIYKRRRKCFACRTRQRRSVPAEWWVWQIIRGFVVMASMTQLLPSLGTELRVYKYHLFNSWQQKYEVDIFNSILHRRKEHMRISWLAWDNKSWD